jgi:O-antigen ligase
LRGPFFLPGGGGSIAPRSQAIFPPGARQGRGPSRHALIAAAFVAAAIVLGGGGSPNPAPELVLQLLAALAILAWLWLPPSPGDRSPAGAGADPVVWAICALVLALPLLQLVPLPPALWTAAPGQESRVAALALVGRADSWQPLTHSPPRTLAALLAIVPALFAFAAVASLDARGRLWVIAAIAAMVLASAVLGAVQLSLGPTSGAYFYISGHRMNLTGFQANRNAQADVLLIGAAAVTVLLLPSLARRARAATPDPRPALVVLDPRTAGLLLAGLLALLLSATVLTGSRAGIALIVPTLLAIWLMLRRTGSAMDRGTGWARWARLAPLAAAVLFLAALAALALRGGNTVLGRVAGRFAFDGDFRTELWRDTLFAIGQNWPVGVGLGGFQPAMLAVERLEVLDPSRPNRAHNDYLEFVLEGGLPAVLIGCAIVALIGARAVRLWRHEYAYRDLLGLGVTIVLILAAHSLVDYPLRSMALACVMGVGAGLLATAPCPPGERRSRPRPVATEGN